MPRVTRAPMPPSRATVGDRVTIEALSIWSLGALFGLRHALDPDHLVAVSTLVAGRSSPRAALAVGVAWGLGHTLALLTVASVLALARGGLSPRLAQGFELGVGIMLVVLGVQSLRRARPGGPIGAHVDHANHPDHAARAHRHTWTSARRSLLVGIAHGLAGSGALTALIAAEFPSVAGRIAYVAVFGIGATIGMAALSGLAGVPLAGVSRRPAVRRALAATGGVLAIGLGVFWVTRQLLEWRGLAAF
jgi:hypothetical protein